jgi:hypothetical protein
VPLCLAPNRHSGTIHVRFIFLIHLNAFPKTIPQFSVWVFSFWIFAKFYYWFKNQPLRCVKVLIISCSYISLHKTPKTFNGVSNFGTNIILKPCCIDSFSNFLGFKSITKLEAVLKSILGEKCFFRFGTRDPVVWNGTEIQIQIFHLAINIPGRVFFLILDFNDTSFCFYATNRRTEYSKLIPLL